MRGNDFRERRTLAGTVPLLPGLEPDDTISFLLERILQVAPTTRAISPRRFVRQPHRAGPGFGGHQLPCDSQLCSWEKKQVKF